MGIKLVVYAIELQGKGLANHFAVERGFRFLSQVGNENCQAERRRHPRAKNAHGFEHRRKREQLFYRCRNNVLSFGGLELLLETADDAKPSLFIDFSAITGVKIFVVCESLPG